MSIEDLYRLIRNGHVQAQGVVDTVGEPLLVLDRSLCVETANRAFFETFAVGRDETIGKHIYELGDGQWNIPELRRLLEDVIPKSTAVLDFEVDHDFPGLGRRTMLLTARRLFHPDTVSRSLLLSIFDATQRRRREVEQDLLVGELRHRMKNLLAMVQAIARQTSVKGRSGEQYRDAFLGRFDALASAHDLAFVKDAEIGLEDLLRRSLRPYAGASAATTVEPGPPVALLSSQILPFSLILHELATNSLKYGALSVPHGQLRVRWDIESGAAPRLRLAWHERKGPPVTTPASTGFGTRLIALAAHELGGNAELDFAPEGLRVEIVAPLRPAS